MITIESKRSGLVVGMADEEYATLLTLHGNGTREYILNNAGRVLSHRRALVAIQQQTITAEQQQQIDDMAHALAIEHAIHCEIIDMGYANYLSRAERGGLMPESWSRIVDNARSKIDVSTVAVTDSFRESAKSSLGLYAERDEEYSRPIAESCNWEITAPESWGKSA